MQDDHEKVLVLDFGGQYNQLIARRVRENHVYCEVHPQSLSLEKIREMVDVNTIIGDPISAPNGTTIIPVSKVSFGFASGGSDLPTQAAEKFAGGAGAGVTVKPQAFIVIKTDGDVELLELGGAGKTSPLEGVVEAIPGVIGKIKDLVGKKNSDSADESDDAE